MTREQDDDRQVIFKRFREAEIAAERFIPVEDGDKASYSHDDRYSDPRNVSETNYGIYADEEDVLVIVDIDDYRSDVSEKTASIQAIDNLPPTLEVETPHGGTHRFYRVFHPKGRSPATICADRLGTTNPVPAWGEVQVANKYVVGAGSELTGCTKEWCDNCSEPNGGRYQIKANRPIATIGFETLIQALTADAKLSDRQSTDDQYNDNRNENLTKTVTDDKTTSKDPDAETAVEDEWLDGELLQEALEYIDPNCKYNKWRNIGFAIADVVPSKERAKRIFKQWSRGCPKWDDQAPELAEDIIDRAGEGKVSPATVVYHAKHGGWTPPEQIQNTEELLKKHHTDGEDELPFWLVRRAAVEFGVCSSSEFVEKEANDGEAYLGFPDVETYNDALDAIEEAGYEHGRDHHRNSQKSDSQVTKTSEDGQTLPIPSQFEMRYGCYYKEEKEGRERRIANFQLEVLSRLTYEDGTRELELRIHPAQGEPYSVTVQPTVFNTFREFRDEVLKGWSTTFSGSREDLNALKEFVGTRSVEERTGVDHLGLHDDEFVLPSGSVTAEGWADTPKFAFTNDSSPLTHKVKLSPETSISEIDHEEVADIVKLLPQTRRPNRFLPVLGWFYAAPTSPLIREWEGEFNLLSVLGETGAGKTTTIELLWQLFGMDADLMPAESTGHSQLTALSSTNSIPVIFDEYKPADISERRLNNLHNHLRMATRGGTESKGNPDLTTTNYQLRAPVCIAGEQLIQGPAEKRRTIVTTFTRDATVGNTPESRAFIRLTGGNIEDTYYDGFDLKQHALLFYQWLLKQNQPDLKELWRECHKRTVTHLKQQGIAIESFDNIVIQGFQTVRFGCNLYRNFAEYLDVDPDTTAVTEKAVDEAIKYIASEGDGSEHTSHLDKFLELCCRAAAADYLEEGEHYRIMQPEARRQPELRLKLSTAIDQVRRYARDHDVQGEDLLETVEDYRARIRDNEKRDDGYITERSVPTRLNSKVRCVGINIRRTSNQVSGFEIQTFSDAVAPTETEDTSAKEGNKDKDSSRKPERTITNEQLDKAIKKSVADGEDSAGTPREEVVIAVADKYGIEQNSVEHRIETLLNQSRGIYEPQDGVLRRL